MKLTEEQMAIVGAEAGPHWHDGCEHGLKDYVASFTIPMNGQVHKFDLYVFPDHHNGRRSVCLRDGDEVEDYISPGSLMQFVKHACLLRHQSPEYWRAFEILEATGVLEWKEKTP